MILLEKRAHFVLKTPPTVVCLLRVDVSNQRIEISRTDRKHPISPLPCEARDSAFFHPGRRRRLYFRHDLRSGCSRSQPDRKVNMICDPTHPKTLAIQVANRSTEVSVKVARDLFSDQRKSTLRAEDNMHKIETQRLGHSGDYISDLPPSLASNSDFRAYGSKASEDSAARGNSHGD